MYRSARRRLVAIASAGAVVAAGAVGLGLPERADAASKVPDTTKLAGALAKQKLTWEKCDFGSASLNDRFANLPNVQCATVEVPRDWHDADNGKTWEIRISQAKNIEVDNPRYKGTLFVNPGGPGGEGLPWGAAMQERTPDLNPYYNYIGFDPRGVGQSSQAECEVTFEDGADPNAENQAIGEQCSKDPDARTINTEQTTYDMDFIRSLLKAPKLSYIGYSYGTWLGSWYSKVFSSKADKILLDSATDVTDPTLQRTWDLQPIARDRQFEKHLMNWIARHDATYGLGTDPAQIRKRYFAATDKLDPFVVTLTWVFGGGISAFPDNSQYPAAAATVQTLISAGEEPESGTRAASSPATAAQAVLAKLAASSTAPKPLRDKATKARADLKPLAGLKKVGSERTAAQKVTETVNDPFEFIRCNDGQWTQGASYWAKKNAAGAKKAPLSASFGMFETAPVCAFWRTSNLMPVADAKTYPKSMVVQGELDSQTAWETGKTTALKLPNTKALFIDNEGSHGLFPYGTECLDRPLINFFLNGKQPKANSKTCQALPLPEETKVFESWGKLNNQGKHTSVVTSPFEEATTKPGQLNAARSLAAVNAPTSSTSLRTVDPALRSSLLDQVRRTYGQAGVTAIEKVTPLG